MKKIIFTIYILVIANPIFTFCQGLPDSSAIWTIAYISWGSYYANETFSIVHDTVIEEKSYKAIYQTKDSIFNINNSNYCAAAREFDNKWYFVPKEDTSEYLLYDFNLDVFDTVKINNPWGIGEVELIAFEVDSVELSGVYYKRIAMGLYDGPSGQPYIWEYWIEGIGSTHGLFSPGVLVYDLGSELLCFHRDDSLIYLDSPDNTCGYIMVSAKSIADIRKIKIYPNPVNDKLNIDSHEYLKSIEIINIFGQVISYVNVDNLEKSFEINVSQFPRVFFVKLIGHDFIWTKKIIKQ